MGESNPTEPTSEELEKLVQFLGKVRILLEWVVTSGDSSVPDYLVSPLKLAWLKTDTRFVTATEEITKADSDLKEKLVAHGLSGDELSLKLIAFDAYYHQWETLRGRQNDPRSRTPPFLVALWRRFRGRRGAASQSNSVENSSAEP
jgi:hypothetical protein